MQSRLFLYFFLLFSGLFCNAQFALKSDIGDYSSPSGFLKSENNYYSNFTILYSNKNFFIPNQLPNLDMQEPIHAISVGFIMEMLTSYNYDYPARWTFSYYLPRTTMINDSLSAYFRGYEHHISFAGQTLINAKHFYFHLTEGISFGRIKLINNDIEKSQKSFYFAIRRNYLRIKAF